MTEQQRDQLMASLDSVRARMTTIHDAIRGIPREEDYASALVHAEAADSVLARLELELTFLYLKHEIIHYERTLRESVRRMAEVQKKMS